MSDERLSADVTLWHTVDLQTRAGREVVLEMARRHIAEMVSLTREHFENENCQLEPLCIGSLAFQVLSDHSLAMPGYISMITTVLVGELVRAQAELAAAGIAALERENRLAHADALVTRSAGRIAELTAELASVSARLEACEAIVADARPYVAEQRRGDDS